MSSKLIPELDVANLDASLHFYVQILGFQVLYDRPKERFAFLYLGGAQLMLEEAAGPGRRFRTAPLTYPFGRGVNFQIEVPDVDALYGKVTASGASVILVLEERWYGLGEDVEGGNRQFVVADPDGYLLRFTSDLGHRDCNPEELQG